MKRAAADLRLRPYIYRDRLGDTMAMRNRHSTGRRPGNCQGPPESTVKAENILWVFTLDEFSSVASVQRSSVCPTYRYKGQRGPVVQSSYFYVHFLNTNTYCDSLKCGKEKLWKNTRIIDQGEIKDNLQLLKMITVEIVGGCGYLICYCCKYVFEC